MAPPHANEDTVYNAKLLSEKLSKADISSVEIPQPFLRLAEHKPTVAHDQWADVPELDFSEGLTDEAGLAKKMVDAVSDCGFFTFRNHGVPMELIEEMQRQGRKFFSLPLEEKQKVSQVGLYNGYTGDFKKHNVDSLRWSENYQVDLRSTEPEDFPLKVWPEGAPEFSAAMRNYVAALEKPQTYIVELLAIGLGLPRDFFAKHFTAERKVRSTMRWNYYPTCPKPMDVLGVGGHSDPVILTILHDGEVGGLQIQQNGEWKGIKPVKGALVCNAGDMLRLWTNDILKSASHRVVVNPHTPRMSTAVFMNPDDETVISASPSLVEDAGKKRLYKDFTMVDFFKAYLGSQRNRRFAMESLMETFTADKVEVSVEKSDA